MKKVYNSILILLISSAVLYADVFKLKSGEIIEGELISEDQKSIVVKIRYGTIKIDKDELITQKVKPPQEISRPRKVLKPYTTRLITQEMISGMRRWLEGQICSKTGLLESYRPTADMLLENQASTYDQALAGISFLLMGDIKKAQAILDFYIEKRNSNGLSNFYSTQTGSPGIEVVSHLGPNLWIALLALHYDRIAKRQQYQKLAVDIVKWAMELPHYKGGAAMSSRDEWRATWTKTVSTENNIDYYAVLSIMENRVKEPVLAGEIRQERLGVADFLKKIVYDKDEGGVYRGFHRGVVDKEYALDSISWLIAAVGIDELRRWGIDTERLMAFAEKKFIVSDEGIKGFDFTDKYGAAKARRARMISIEWTFAMVNTFCIYRNYYYKLAVEQEDLGNNKIADKLHRRADIYDNKMVYFSKEMDKKLLRFGPKKDLYAYPYATRSYWQVFYDSSWWKTPKASSAGIPPGSVASTTWRLFAGRFNPLDDDGSLK